MLTLGQIKIRNRLLAHMPESDFERLKAHLEPVELPRAFALSAPGQISNYCYFIEQGIGSIVAELSGGKRAEIGLFGWEGMSPAALVLNAHSTPYFIFMQVSGNGFRVESSQVSYAIAESITLRNLLTLYAQTMAVQTAFTSVVNATQHIEQRLARWILMCHDRVEGDNIALTHEFMAMMLAVRRQSVTTALHILEGEHFVRAERGRVLVCDRKGLEKFAGDSYGAPEREYNRLMGF